MSEVEVFEKYEAFKKRMEKIEKHTHKLGHFKLEQLLCLHMIASKLISIADSLKTISSGLSKTSQEEDKKDSPSVREISWTKEEED